MITSGNNSSLAQILDRSPNLFRPQSKSSAELACYVAWTGLQGRIYDTV